MQEYLNIIPFYRIAGPMILPLWACSVVAVAVILEKSWFFAARLDVAAGKLDLLASAARSDDNEVLVELSIGRGPVGLIARALMAHREPAAIQRLLSGRMDEAGKRLSWLSVVATVAPMLGLLGTVTGMIRTFGILHEGGIGDPTRLAGGINEALYTTALGLSIAVPTYIVYRALDGMLRQRARILDDLLDEIFVEPQHQTDDSATGTNPS